MAITFTQEKKKQKYLILILVLAVFLIFFTIWLGFLRPEKEPVPVVSPVFIAEEVKINWDVLQEEKLQDLKEFEGIAEFENDIGRENPFLPY